MKVRLKRFILTAFLYLLMAGSFAQAYENVDAATFKKMYAENPSVLLDTRTAKEFERGHIAGATLVNLQDRSAVTELLTIDKSKTLYLYCYSGARSRSVATFLSQNGYANVVNLSNGLIGWSRAGFPLEKTTNSSAVASKGVSPAGLSAITSQNKLVFVDFYAPWCAPCKKMLPYVDELAKTYAGKVKVVKINADTSKELMKRLDITGVPYLLLYENGKVVFTANGAMSRDEIISLFDKYLIK